MGLQEVKAGLEKELKDKSLQLEKEAEAERKRILSEAEAEIGKARERFVRKTNELIGQLERSEIASANLGLKKEVLNAKKGAIDSAFEEARKTLSSYSKDRKKNLVKGLIEKAQKEIDVAKVYCGDPSLVSGFKAEKADFEGGVICESEDGKSRVDLRFETLLEDIREKDLKEIAEVLFR